MANTQTAVDPYYVQISRQEAAKIIGRSPSEFDRLRKSDQRCPQGHKTSNAVRAKVLFRLSEIYTYSEALMSDSM